MNKTARHYEENAFMPIAPATLFAYVDDHSRLSSHMNRPSWMMGGGRMDVQVDEGKGQVVGSHIRLNGKILGINLFLDEVIVQHDPPHWKAWQTVGDLRLLVIGHYRMGFEIIAENEGSRLKVFIDYELPATLSMRWLGYLFGGMYTKWCVRQMLQSARQRFDSQDRNNIQQRSN